MSYIYSTMIRTSDQLYQINRTRTIAEELPGYGQFAISTNRTPFASGPEIDKPSSAPEVRSRNATDFALAQLTTNNGQPISISVFA